MTPQKSQKIPKLFSCESCHYNTSSKKDFSKHLLTQKHKKGQNTYKYLQNGDKNPKDADDVDIKHVCHCGNSYKHRQSLNNHKKKCNNYNDELKPCNNNYDFNDVYNDISGYKELMIELIKQNKEMQEIVFQQSKEHQKQMNYLIPKIGNNTINNNQRFNINIFLNENCKDAMNIHDFVEGIEISTNDLLITKDKGLISGISNIVINELNKLPFVQRPLWCSDKKRRRLFIKEDKWTEDVDNNITKEFIKNVSKKQTKNINKYSKEHPNWMNNDKIKDNYLLIIKNATDSIDDKTDKVIDTLINTIHIDDNKNKILFE